MNYVKVAVITTGDSDLLRILQADMRLQVQVIPVGDVHNYNLDLYDAFFLLGGTCESVPIFTFPDRHAIEAQIAKGKKVFSEFFGSIGEQYNDSFRSTRFSRMIYSGEHTEIDGIEVGDILEDQCNVSWNKHYGRQAKEVLLVSQEHIPAHRKTNEWAAAVQNPYQHTLWIDTDNLMICTFRLCNFIRACFAPKKAWRSLVEYIIHWTTGVNVSSASIPDAYTRETYDENKSFEEQALRTVRRGADWVENAGMLIDNGKSGMYEGWCTEIYPDGSRKKMLPIRDDCVGEISMFLGMDCVLTGNEHSLEISDNLIDFMFREMQIKTGPYAGMIRWSDTAWTVAYTHDTGRAVFGELLKNLYLGRDHHMDDIRAALDFLIKTSGCDGYRDRRTDTIWMSEASMREMHRKPRKPAENDPRECGIDTYAMAAMLLFYKLTGDEKYRDWGCMGMEEILPKLKAKTLDSYVGGLPDSASFMPLAIYYHISKNEEAKNILYGLAKANEMCRHPNGGYVSRLKNGVVPPPNIGAEGSLLTSNEDPIIDNLYSSNWFSMGFAQAYLVTGDSYFLELWRDIVKYYITSQIVSDNPEIHGAWARAEDRTLMEINGIPNDIGWGPWSIETGWSIGQICAGIAVGLKAEELRKFYI